MKPALVLILIGNLIGTSYRSVPEQTDASPNFTATGEKTCGHGIAVSLDLLRSHGGPLEFGDDVYIEGIGLKVVNDVMNRRHKQRIDIWVATYKEEKEFDLKFGNKKLKVWKVITVLERETQNEQLRQGFRTKIWQVK